MLALDSATAVPVPPRGDTVLVRDFAPRRPRVRSERREISRGSPEIFAPAELFLLLPALRPHHETMPLRTA